MKGMVHSLQFKPLIDEICPYVLLVGVPSKFIFFILPQTELNCDPWQALKEELENTKSLMHKAGLGIRLPVQNVRELTEGDVDQRCSQTQPPSRGEPRLGFHRNMALLYAPQSPAITGDL